jgi:hypothetical protein
MFAVMQMFDIIALNLTETNTMKPRNQQDDRLLKQLTWAERRRQELLRRRIASDLSYLLA